MRTCVRDAWELSELCEFSKGLTNVYFGVRLSPMDGRREVKKQKFVQAIISGKNIKQSAIAAGYTERSAYSAGSRLHHLPDVQEAISKELEKQGLTQDVFVAKLREGLEATQTRNHKTTPDHDARFKYWQSWGKMSGYMKDESPKTLNLFTTQFQQAYEKFISLQKDV